MEKYLQMAFRSNVKDYNRLKENSYYIKDLNRGIIDYKNFVEMPKQVARLAAHPKTAANGGQNLWRTAAKAGQNALKKGRYLPIMDTAEHCANNHNIACSTKSKGENEHDLFA